MRKIALLGCGHKQDLMVKPQNQTKGVDYELVRYDINPKCEPDVLRNLASLEYGTPLGETYDEVHAYEFLEHIGRQGDYVSFFETFNALGDSLKDGGRLVFTCPKPTSVWAWGDPGHTRIISPEAVSFLAKKMYDNLEGTSTSDYRSLVKWWWAIQIDGSSMQHSNIFILRKEEVNDLFIGDDYDW